MFSNNLFAVFALAVVAFGFAVIYVLDKRKFNWGVLLIIALAAGILIGILFRDNKYFTNNLEYVSLLGRIYIGLTEALVAPLILLTIISSVTTLNDSKKLKTIGLKSMFWLLLNTAIAIVLTIATSILLQVGKNLPLALDDVNAKKYANINTKFIDVIEGFFPHNIFNELANNKVISIIMVALALSVAYISFKDKKEVEYFRLFAEAAKKIVYKIVAFIVDLIPYAILVLAADAVYTVSKKLSDIQNEGLFQSVQAIWSIVLVMLVIIALCLFQTFVVSGFLVKFVAKLSPGRFFGKISDALLAGASTQSTLAVVPTTVNSLVKKIGVREEISNFTASLGATIGMPGCSGIWPVVLAIAAINGLDIPYSPTQYLTLGIIAFAVSFGTAGVQGTAIIVATAVFTTAGLPLEAMVLLLPISFIVGMFRTPANVACAAAAAAIVARQTGALNDDIFNGKISWEDSQDKKESSINS